MSNNTTNTNTNTTMKIDGSKFIKAEIGQELYWQQDCSMVIKMMFIIQQKRRCLLRDLCLAMDFLGIIKIPNITSHLDSILLFLIAGLFMLATCLSMVIM